MRSIGAVVAGYLIFALSAVVLFQITGQAPHRSATAAFMIASAMYGIGFAALGGFVAARLAPTRPQLHAGMVAGIIMLGATASLLTAAGADARWSQLAALGLMAPAAWLGGYWRVRHAGGAA